MKIKHAVILAYIVEKALPIMVIVCAIAIAAFCLLSGAPK